MFNTITMISKKLRKRRKRISLKEYKRELKVRNIHNTYQEFLRLLEK